MNQPTEQSQPRHEPEVSGAPPPPKAKAAKLSRQEAHDIGMLIKERARVLKSHAEEQAAAHLADFETQISKEYKFDQDEVWEKVSREAARVVTEANEKILERCKELGVPAPFAPSLELKWHRRGQNLMGERRAELRAKAKTAIEAMTRSAIRRIDQQAVDLRTQVVSSSILSEHGQMFLESLAPVQDSMQAISFSTIQKEIEAEKKKRDANHRALYGDTGYGVRQIGYDED